MRRFAVLILSVLVTGVSLSLMAADAPLRTIMPYSLLYGGDDGGEKLIERLRAVKARSGIRRFVLSAPSHVVRVTGYAKLDEYERIGARLKRVNEELAEDGIEAGYLVMPTLKCGINHPWTKITGANGKESPISACPADPGFRSYFVSNLTAVARIARPFLIMIEDDFQPHNHPKIDWFGCFCARHLSAFAKRTGKTRTREELYRLFHEMNEPDAYRLRCEWERMLCADLVSLSAELSASVASVSPRTRLALSAPGCLNEPMDAVIAQALAGAHRPAVRYHGSHYGMDTPTDLPPMLHSAQWCRENLSSDIEFWHEADPCPHNPFYASAVRMEALMSSTMAMGYDAPYFWGLEGSVDALERSGCYLDMYRESASRLKAIRDEAKRGKLVGVGVRFDPWMRFQVPYWGEEGYESCSWHRVLNRMGIPVSLGESAVSLYAGRRAFSALSDDEVRKVLAGRVLLDGAAAESLVDRGFGGLVGLRHEACDKVLFTGERVVADGTLVKSAMHQNYGLDNCRVSRLLPDGAEELSVYYAGHPTNVVQSSVTRFVNGLGGRVGVLALDLRDAITPNLFAFRKRDLLVEVCEWLADGHLPIRVVDRPNVMLLANEDKGRTRLFSHLVNLSCDVQLSVSFAVAPRYAGGAVEILDGATWKSADCGWKGRELTVRADVPVYKTLVLRLKRKGTD